MALTIPQQIAAAREAGYVVKKNHNDRFTYTPPGMAESRQYDDEFGAWAHAAEHMKKNKKALAANKFAVLGLDVMRYGGNHVREVKRWRAVVITNETPTTITVDGRLIGFYDKKRKKDEILQRFTSLEDAEAFIARAVEAVAPQTEALASAIAAREAAQEVERQARNQLHSATKVWVELNVAKD